MACSFFFRSKARLLSTGVTPEVRLLPTGGVGGYQRGSHPANHALRGHQDRGPTSSSMLHKTRDLSARQRMILINCLRGHLARGSGHLPEVARLALHGIVDQIRQLGRLEALIVARHRASDVGGRLATIPGIGPITASAITAAVPNGSLFGSGRLPPGSA
jgi:transposase